MRRYVDVGMIESGGSNLVANVVWIIAAMILYLKRQLFC